MTGRGRGRPPARQSAEPTAPAGRRSTRQQQPQQQSQPQLPQPDPQIDPAITASEASSMPPPPIPSSKRGRVADAARRGTRRDTRPESLASISSVLTSQELQDAAILSGAPTPATVFSTPARDISVMSSEYAASPGRDRGRSKVMKSFLGPLSFASDQLSTHLLAVFESIEDEWDEQRQAYRHIFSDYRRYYLQDEGSSVIKASYVLPKMGAQRDDPLWSKTVKVISLANLVEVLDEITPTKPEDELSFLKKLDRTFPESYLYQVTGQNVMLDKHVLDLALEIRTQLLVFNLMKLQADSSEPFNPYESVLEAFCEKDMTVQELVALQNDPSATLHFEPVAGLQITGGWQAENYLARIRTLCSQLPDKPVQGIHLELDTIEDNYPFADFIKGLREFIGTRIEDTKASLQSIPPGSVESQIQDQLQAELSQTSGGGDTRAQSLGILGALRVMSDLEQQGDIGRLGSQDIIERSHQIQSSAYPSVPYPPGFGAYADLPTQSNGSIYAESAAQATRKKRRGAGDGETGQTPAKKPRTRRKQNAAAPSVPSATPGAESQYPPPPASQVEPDFEALSQRSREISAASRKAREPQVRSAWVRNDVKQLVKAVDTFKCKWSLIEREIKAGTIPFEIPRDQQALRDKARLLKQDFLKADGILPPSFDLVVLGKKERNAVIACGKNPDRREADVLDGHPVNTEHVGDNVMPAPAPALEAAPGTMPEAPMDAPIEADVESEPVAA